MPFAGPAAEAPLEAVEKVLGQRDLGHQHKRLPALPQRLGKALEIDLRLARPRDAIEQQGPERLRLDRLVHGQRGLALRIGQIDGAETRIGIAKRPRGGKIDRLQHIRLDQPGDDGGGHAGDIGQRPFGPDRLFRKMGHDLVAGGGLALRIGSRPANPGDRFLGLQGIGRAQHHLEHHAPFGQRVSRHEIDQRAQLGPDRRQIETAQDIAQFLRIDGVRFGIPDAAQHGARPERHLDDVAGRKPAGEVRGHAVAVGAGHHHRALDSDRAGTHGRVCDLGQLGLCSAHRLGTHPDRAILLTDDTCTAAGNLTSRKPTNAANRLEMRP